MVVSVPDVFADITLSWLNEALVEGGVLDVDVATVEVVPLDPSKGLIGDLASVQVTYARGAGPASFIVKLPAANPDSRAVGAMLAAYAREVAFYRHVAPLASGARLPACYYSGADDNAGRWALVLEEVDADPFDFQAGASLEMAHAALDALADFHRMWWDSPTTFAWMPGLDTSDLGGLQAIWQQNLPAFVERYQKWLPGASAQWVLEFANHLRSWSARVAQEPLTMVHSDYRLDNLLFSGPNVTMIDWQTAMRAPAAMDVSCFLTTSLSIADRRTHQDALIDRYLTRLTQDGIVVDPAWFQRSYQENILWWMGQFGNNLAHLDPGDDRVQAALNTMVNRVYTAGLDLGVIELL